ncbi:sugar ABC transporter permease [Lachnospiraceae bacterium JLR.KK009]|nr:multiple sugar transport system permease [Lachnospiraceae bacterium A2]MCI8705529.1 sugar ABC transporter permease [Lachnospiraceae bacterium]
MKKSKARSVFIGVCVAPAVILFIIFMLVPTFNIFKMSLYKWGGFSNSKEFIGLNNFKTLLADTKFLRTFQNSILLVVCVTVITISFSLIFAAIISREKIKGENFFRIIFYIPNILSIVIISAIFSAIYDPTNGLLNSVLGIFRGEKDPILWLGDQKIVIFSLVIALVWQAIGYYMVMYMASMASIPASIYESADLEGANHIQQFFSITLPLIWTNIRTTLSFFVISTINLSFQLVKVLTNGGPDGATDVFLSYMYNQAYTNSSYGYGMAIGVVVFLFSFGLAAVISFVTKREPLEF